MLNKIRLANVVEVSELGFGCARLHGGAVRRESEKMLDFCMQNGVNFFDTAPLYGSEELLGSFFAGDKSVVISTKVGLEPKVDNTGYVKGAYRRYLKSSLTRLPLIKHQMIKFLQQENAHQIPIRRKLNRDEIMRSVERSLRLLKRDRLDLLLLHEPDLFLIDDDLKDIFETLISDGVISAYGQGYGRSPVVGESLFGNILQAKYRPGVLNTTPESLSIIYHGVIREALASTNYFKGVTFKALLKQSLMELRGVPKLVSASTPQQLHRLLQSIRRLG